MLPTCPRCSHDHLTRRILTNGVWGGRWACFNCLLAFGQAIRRAADHGAPSSASDSAFDAAWAEANR
jgi:transcription elongation factor Elf1